MTDFWGIFVNFNNFNFCNFLEFIVDVKSAIIFIVVFFLTKSRNGINFNQILYSAVNCNKIVINGRKIGRKNLIEII